jgi:beta-hydroxylase
MVSNLKSKVSHFMTLQVANRVLMGLGNVISPFSKVSTTPILPKEEFDWAKLLEENWQTIQAEVSALLANEESLPNIQDIQPAESALTTDNNWKTFFLQGFGHKAERNRELCPETAKVLDQIPGLLTAFFSILHPGKHIPAHKGIFKGIVRTHLGLTIPGKPGECKMRVGNEYIYWEEGKAVFFDDTYNHEVWNNTNGTRIVLLIDTKRPYTGIGEKVNNFVIKSITNSVYVKDAMKKNEDWEKVYYDVLA